MKTKVLLFAALFIGFTACFGSMRTKHRKVSKQELFGDWEGRTYRNPLFNIQVEIPEDWSYDADHFKTGFGGTVIDASNDTEDPLYGDITFHMEVDKLNPFDRNPSAARELQESSEASEMIFGSENVNIEPMTKTKIAGKEFVSQRVEILDQESKTFTLELISISDGYSMTIACTYQDEEGEEEIMNLIQSIKKLK